MCDVCKEQVTDVPAQDWKVSLLEDRGPTAYYRYRVTGENLNWPVGHRERHFVWSVPGPLDTRFDLSDAKRVTLVPS